jgi:hypothetical protein
LDDCSQRESALIDLWNMEKRLAITVRGAKTPIRLTRIITSLLNLLINNWFHVAVKRFIPCPHCLEKFPEQVNFFSQIGEFCCREFFFFFVLDSSTAYSLQGLEVAKIPRASDASSQVPIRSEPIPAAVF